VQYSAQLQLHKKGFYLFIKATKNYLRKVDEMTDYAISHIFCGSKYLNTRATKPMKNFLNF
jgi:uncharacterized protein YutD